VPDDMDLMYVAQERDKWQAPANTIMNNQVA
jgi:hypothetical protein